MPVILARKEAFSAAHRLFLRDASDEENEAIYGKCAGLNGHGHNYRVEVSVLGEVDKTTGMLLNLVDLKSLIWNHALLFVDHKNLDKDVKFFENKPSTAENVAIFLWECLVDKIPSPARLYEIKLHETDNNYVIYRG